MLLFRQAYEAMSRVYKKIKYCSLSPSLSVAMMARTYCLPAMHCSFSVADKGIHKVVFTLVRLGVYIMPYM